MKPRAHIIFLLLTTLLLARLVVPHHHHANLPCAAQQLCTPHGETNDEHTGHHDDGTECFEHYEGIGQVASRHNANDDSQAPLPTLHAMAGTATTPQCPTARAAQPAPQAACSPRRVAVACRGLRGPPATIL